MKQQAGSPNGTAGGLGPSPPKSASFGIDGKSGYQDVPLRSPEEEANFFSKLVFFYVNKLVNQGAKKHLEHDDLWPMAKRDEADAVFERFRGHLKSTVSEKHPQGYVWGALRRAHGMLMLQTGIIKVIHDCVMFLPPFLLEQLLKHISRGGSRLGAFGWACTLFGAAITEALFINYYFQLVYRLSLHMKTEMIAMIYEKSLRVTNAVKSEMGVGGIVNLQSNDASKIWTLPLYIHIVWNGPFQILVVMALLVRLMDWGPAMSGLAVTVIMIPLTVVVGKALAKVRRFMVKQIDARVKMATEVITGIKAIKLYAWEEPYMESINKLREKELKSIRSTQMLSLLNMAIYTSGPVLVALAAFAVYSWLGNTLTAAVAFPALSLFNLLRFPIIMFPNQIMNMIHARVGLQRIQKFVEADEMEPRALTASPATRDSSLRARKSLGGREGSIRAGKQALTTAPDVVPAALSAPSEASAGLKPVDAGAVMVQLDGSDKPAALAAQPPANGHAVTNGHVNGTANGVVHHESAHQQNGVPMVDGSGQAAGSGPAAVTGGQDEFDVAIDLKEGTYRWEADKEPVLSDISLKVEAGQLVMVVGQVGSGKSSLLYALLGEIHRIKGDCSIKGSVAYTSQDPWIQNTTLRSNVLLGMPFDEDAYTEILAACALGPDLVMLPAGDATEIGEKGVNLSGGQKHRVALARAAYAAADVYLLDDPLSAVDAHVGRLLFDECICGLLAGRTRVLVTHQLQFLPAADVVVVMAEGRIKDIGSYQDLIDKGLDLNQFVAKKEVAEEGDQAEAPMAPAGKGLTVKTFTGTRSPSHSAANSPRRGEQAALKRAASRANLAQMKAELSKSMQRKEAEGKIIKVEERAVGQVKRSVYKAYLKAWSTVIPFLTFFVVLLAFIERGLQIGQNYILTFWTNDTKESEEQGKQPRTSFWLSLYFMLGMVSIAMQLIRSLGTVIGSISASRSLHSALMNKVVRLPMSFFDSQPTGRLLNRLTKDTEAVDVQVSSVVNSALQCLVNVILSVVVVAIVSPIALIAVVPLTFLYYHIQRLYIASSRELKRLDSLAFSPIFQHFSESLHGLTSIRAFSKQALFLEKNKANLNHSNRAYWPIQVVNRWLSVRLELMGATVTFATAVSVSAIMPRNSGLVGLAITSALNLTSVMNWMVRQLTDLEVNMNSVERMVEYKKYEEEAPAVLEGKRPPKDWPQKGSIEAKGLTVKYRPELDPVLRDLSFVVNAREKIGVCGRTGCGKSTLMITLYRLIEPTSGTIIIDGVDITTIGLRDLRSKLSLVPQDPVIFSGTIRTNLDPFNAAESELQIWESLRRAGMEEFVKAQEGGLDAPIKEGGANLSVGQRQLLCMARALLRTSRILVLDEATSNVDNATDTLIQTTIRSAFNDCTVLTIAHRLHTIIDSDRILLLDAGQLLEFDTPQELLRRPESAFRHLVEETTKGGGLNAGAVVDALADANAYNTQP